MVDMAEDAVQKEVKDGPPKRPRIVDEALQQVARLVGDRTSVRSYILNAQIHLRAKQKEGTAKKRQREAQFRDGIIPYLFACRRKRFAIAAHVFSSLRAKNPCSAFVPCPA